MKRIVPLLVDAPDELSQAGLIGVLTGGRYKPVAARPGWVATAPAGRSIPDLAICVLNTKDELAIIRKIEAMATHSKVVLLADHFEPHLIRGAICAGAVAYLPRSVETSILFRTLDLVMEGELVIPASIGRRVLADEARRPHAAAGTRGSRQLTDHSDHVARLSRRETDILKQLVFGNSNKQIARRFDISETTVKVHVKAILRKIRARNRTQAAMWAIDHMSDLTGRSPPLSNEIPTFDEKAV